MTTTPIRLSIFSTNVRFIASLYRQRIGFRTSSILAPGLAELWAERIFLTPPRAPGRTPFALADGRARFVESRGRSLASWSWGPPSAPAVVLAHGWGGSAAQLKDFVAPLRAAGWRVIAYDQPAHGLSSGRIAGLPDFARALASVCAAHGGVRAVIGHSLGATGATLALAESLPLECAVLISPPDDLVAHSRRFSRWLWIPEAIRARMQAAIEERYGLEWAALETARLAPALRARALVIHDSGDRVVPSRQGQRLATRWPGARLLLTTGLGHARILGAQSVIEAAVAFIASRSGVASPAAPSLPQPAALY